MVIPGQAYAAIRLHDRYVATPGFPQVVAHPALGRIPARPGAGVATAAHSGQVTIR
jgi:hypothetical protein